jgi:hypothetical protein
MKRESIPTAVAVAGGLPHNAPSGNAITVQNSVGGADQVISVGNTGARSWHFHIVPGEVHRPVHPSGARDVWG